jgi:osmotically-inducible protein OsmY
MRTTIMDDKRQAETSPQERMEHAGQRPLADRARDEVSSWFGNAGAASRRQRDTAAGDHSGKGPESHLDPDARIVDEVGKRLSADAAIDASKIEVVSHDGAVTLNGEVTTSAARAHAEEVAHAVAGVSQVENRLLVA